MTHKQRKARRKLISELIASGEDPHQVAATHQVDLQSVRLACQENGVECKMIPAASLRRFSSYKLLADLINSSATFASLAIKYGVTPNAIMGVYERAQAVGIVMPVRRPGRPYPKKGT